MEPSAEQPIKAKDIRWIDWMIIAIVAGVVLGLIARTRGGKLPMHSPNDKSRWSTVYALAEFGEYATDKPPLDQPPWKSIDRVQFNGRFYSTKPPLLPTLLAGEYILLREVSGGVLSLVTNPAAVIRVIVASLNGLGMVVFLVFYSKLLNRLSLPLPLRVYSLVAAGLGTFLTGFSVTLNNHTVAAYSSFFALYLFLRIHWDEQSTPLRFGLAGFFAGFTAVNELPATAFLVSLGALLVWKSPKKAVLFALPAALIPIGGHVYTNYLVTGGLSPAYANKSAYEFEGSYWVKDPVTGRLVSREANSIDSLHEPWHVYLFNMVLGHHGIFSLSPIFVFSFIGIFTSLRSGDRLAIPAALALGLSLLLLAFLLWAPSFGVGQRNYGGMCCGLRWLFWLIPQWLLFLPVGLRGRDSSFWRVTACFFLAISAASAFYAVRGPWSRPWLHEILHHAGYLTY